MYLTKLYQRQGVLKCCFSWCNKASLSNLTMFKPDPNPPFLACLTFKCDRWYPSMNLNWSYHFKTLKLEPNHLFFIPVNLKFNQWPSMPLVHHIIAICKFKFELQFGDAQFRSILLYLSCVTLKFDRLPWKTMWHLFLATSSFVQHFIAICELKLELQSRNTQIGTKFVFTSLAFTFDSWSWHCAWTSLLPMVITPENLIIPWQDHCEKDRQMDGQTDKWWYG